jgi:hypothetical protein
VAALDFGANEFLDLENDDLGRRSAALVRPGVTLVTVAGPPEVTHRRPPIGRVAELADAASALDPATRAAGKTVIRIRP